MVTKKEEEERKKRLKGGREFIAEREKAVARLQEAGQTTVAARREVAKGGGGLRGAIGAGVGGQVTVGAAQEEIARQQQFEQLTGAGALGEEVGEKIVSPLSLEPEPLGERLEGVAEIGLQPAAKAGNLWTAIAEKVTGKDFARTDAAELAETKAGKALGLATVGMGIAVAGGVAAPFVAAAAAKTAVFGAVTGATGSATLFRKATESILLLAGAGAGVKAAFDFKGGEMNTHRKRLQKMVEDGERLEAMARNGFETGDTVDLLRTMSGEIDNAEAVLKELGNNNLQYRINDEYLTDMVQVRSAREAVLRRILAVENIAITGQAQFNPAALMYQVDQF